MKRIIAFILLIILSLGVFAGCGKKSNEANKPQEPSKQEQIPDDVPTTDADGNKLSEQDRKNIAKHQEIEKVLMEYFQLYGNYDKNTADTMLAKLSPLITPEFYADLKKTIEQDKKDNYSVKLINADVIHQDATITVNYNGKEYKNGNAVYTETEVEVIENGKTAKYTIMNNLINKDGVWLITGHQVKK